MTINRKPSYSPSDSPSYSSNSLLFCDDPITPYTLFAYGAQGIFLDPSNFSTLFQDAAGTIPVTKLGQSVGKILDLSGRGNHVVQATAASQWTIQARNNQLVSTAAGLTQSVTLLATPYTLSFKGTGTVTLSGASTAGPLVGTGVSDRVSLTFTPTAGSVTFTLSGTITEEQLEYGSTATTYQAVVSATDYTDIGISPYLELDGTDDSAATAAIVDFSATDTVSIWSGVRKERDATAIVMELGPDANSTTGSFYVAAPSSDAPQFGVFSRGTASAYFVQSGHPAPKTALLFVQAKISTDFLSLSVNGGTPTTSASDQGTGNYSATQKLFFGRRNNTNLPFKGRLYAQCVYSGLVSEAEQKQISKWFYARMPAV